MASRVEIGGFPVVSHGTGPDTLFVHGGPGLNDYLGPLSEVLADVVRSHRYTMRGNAPSPLDGPFTVGQHVADAVGILDGLGLNRAILMGHSWGGLVAAAIAVARPERVRAMVLIDSTGLTGNGGIDEFFDHFDQAYTAEDTARVAELESLQQGRPLTEEERDEVRRMDWRYYHADPANPPPYLERAVCPAAAEEGLRDTRRLLADDAFRPLAAHPVPTLVLSGDHSPFPQWVFAETAALIPGSVEVSIAGAGHYPWYEQPEQITEAVERFVAQLADAPHA